MSLSTVCSEPSLGTKLALLFCMFWPFLATLFLRRGGRSSAPLTAMLVPLAVAACAMGLNIARVLEGMAISGAGRASTAAGLAEALFSLSFGLFSALGVALFALLKRHRPVADRGSLIVAVLLIANIATALLFTPVMTSALAAAGAAAAIAVGAFVWLVLVLRQRIMPRPIPFAFAAIVVALLVLGVVVRQRVVDLQYIAMHG